MRVWFRFIQRYRFCKAVAVPLCGLIVNAENFNDKTYVVNKGTLTDSSVPVNIIFVSNESEMALRVAAENGGTVVLNEDVTLTEALTIATGKDVTLDLNGKTISHVKECTASYSMITNKGKLTITGSGTISFEDLGAGPTGVSWGTYLKLNFWRKVMNLLTMVMEHLVYSRKVVANRNKKRLI